MTLAKATRQDYTTTIGIDASTKTVAFSVFIDGKLRHYGSMDITGKDIYRQCGDVNRKVYALCRKFEPDYVLIEAPIFVNNRAVVLKLSKLFGSIIGVIASQGISVSDISPAGWMAEIGNPTRDSDTDKDRVKRENPKKSATWVKAELRKMRKQRTMDWVKSTYGVDISDDNVADAIAIGHYAVRKGFRG
jgi:Holliday junction resolvasome RuvABC endonuclease subunit